MKEFLTGKTRQKGSSSFIRKISDPESLSNGLNKVLLDSQYAQSLSKSARKKVEKYTWNERVLKISSVF
ncbi:MAG: hypothetical protein KAI72_05940 [Candidatus Pacebacteria bacterium]|nr:hypothetical protein [Candidatus Paceibacterota bacterium]